MNVGPPPAYSRQRWLSNVGISFNIPTLYPHGCMMASSRKSTIFRVTGLATTQPDDVLDAALKDAIHGNLLNDERSEIQIITAIVPSCYDNEHERVALVEFRGRTPKFLSELVVSPLGDWQVEMEDTDISFDCHFFGFTQLYALQPDAPVAAEYAKSPQLWNMPIGYLANLLRPTV